MKISSTFKQIKHMINMSLFVFFATEENDGENKK